MRDYLILWQMFPVCNDLSSVDLLAAPLRGVNTAVYLAWNNTILKERDIYSNFNDIYSESENLRHFGNFLKLVKNQMLRKLFS